MEIPLTVTEPIRAAALRELSSAGVELIYLFGSLASGRQRPGSDLDIAFLSPAPRPPLDCFEAAQRLSDELHTEVDLVDLARASTVLRKQIVATGVCLYFSSSRARAEFEMRTLADYARLNEERRPVLQACGALR